jgi:crotonobetainyl-CoA:carnitine CoA-transferase CaiB-like acyl-CoA transferase
VDDVRIGKDLDTSPDPPPTGPLRGLLALELADPAAGSEIGVAFCGKLLGDLGATVIKLEPPHPSGEAGANGPDDLAAASETARRLFLDANKQSVALDISTEAGRTLFEGFVARADVLAHNLRSSDATRLDLTAERLQALNPRLVLTAITPFGQFGPYADYKAHAINIAAIAAILYRIGDPRRHPITTPFDRSHYWGGLNGAAATMVALMSRLRSGEGQVVDISSAECMMSFLNHSVYIAGWLQTGVFPTRAGRRLRGAYPWVIMPCKDGHMFLLALQEEQWQRFLAVLGNPEWARSDRYKDRLKVGHEYPEEVDALLRPWFAERTRAELWELLRRHRIPFQPILNVREALESAHLEERGFLRELVHPEHGPLRHPGPFASFSRTPAAIRTPAPAPGQDTERVSATLVGLEEPDSLQQDRAGAVREEGRR